MERSLHERSSRQVKSLFLVAVNLLYMYSTACVYVNRKTRIKHAKKRFQLQIKKIVHIQKIARVRTTFRSPTPIIVTLKPLET